MTRLSLPGICLASGFNHAQFGFQNAEFGSYSVSIMLDSDSEKLKVSVAVKLKDAAFVAEDPLWLRVEGGWFWAESPGFRFQGLGLRVLGFSSRA